MENKHIDLHCHPSLKPFGKSFSYATQYWGNNPESHLKYNSIWRDDPPTTADKISNIFLSVTKFTQSDFQTFYKGKGKVILVSLGPMEKGLVLGKNGTGITGRLLRNFATGVSIERIKYLQKLDDYYVDLIKEYDYFDQLNNKEVTFEGNRVKYKIVSDYAEIDNTDSDTIYVILTIEGCHVLNTLINGRATLNDVKTKIRQIKQWQHRLFFVSLAHHFENGICGHAKSFPNGLAKFFNQKPDTSIGISENLGYPIIRELLSKENGKRIYIDLKHMNALSRKEYYSFLETEYTNEFNDKKIPLIVSHGSVNKLSSSDNFSLDSSILKENEISFFDDELIKISSSNGIFGIQLDERRLRPKSKIPFKNIRFSTRRMKRYRSKFVWLQIQYIAELLDKNGHNAWDLQAIGSDFDGIINPLNGFWTSSDIESLREYLLIHCNKYLKTNSWRNLQEKNQLSSETIIGKFMYLNAEQFLKNYLN